MFGRLQCNSQEWHCSSTRSIEISRRQLYKIAWLKYHISYSTATKFRFSLHLQKLMQWQACDNTPRTWLLESWVSGRRSHYTNAAKLSSLTSNCYKVTTEGRPILATFSWHSHHISMSSGFPAICVKALRQPVWGQLKIDHRLSMQIWIQSRVARPHAGGRCLPHEPNVN